ncbi:hypothetical protein AC624_10770 [Bacillus sp. FJAT-27238]|nr:hypothetical protein AC624_10770 [Bacillus sp. FJAT-27238]
MKPLSEMPHEVFLVHSTPRFPPDDRWAINKQNPLVPMFDGRGDKGQATQDQLLPRLAFFNKEFPTLCHTQIGYG